LKYLKNSYYLNCCLYLRINHFYYHEYALFLANKTIKHKLPHHQGIDKYLFIVYSINMSRASKRIREALKARGVIDAEKVQREALEPIIIAS